MRERLDAHELNAPKGVASGPAQARNFGSYTPTSRDSGGI
jgi:hypothetical protein